ncbi:SRPBCC family protein [Hoeflea sp. YIM 152468]|uniref:SRPBCC family protein n=1 Tax=Hoeflea sp. YIM 152468 TaxID=3031759 RepID=UPI0023D9CD44|nr:SRPBCC family protein [Hoeflea sp. YIM 152468]MDF1610149.1 SRPBCC family protein [Hoeflea sp. YIM 152468]
MACDLEQHLGKLDRSVIDLEKDGRPARSVILSRLYETDMDDLWDALTNGERIPRWFLPLEGDLRLGGRFQFKGNAGGEIVECEPPRHLAVTWEMHADVSWVEGRLTTEAADVTRLTLTHTAIVSAFWHQYGPGAVGVGWELGFVGLASHLAAPDAPRMDEEAFSKSAAGKGFMRQSARLWGEADIARGETPLQAQAAAERTAGFYLGVSQG